MTTPDPTEPTSTRRAILDLLKAHGELDTSGLAEQLEITPTAVRLQLSGLEEDELVTARDEVRGRGRPAKVWSLTRAADTYFPDTHANLALDLIASMKDALGPEAFQKMLAHRADRQVDAYEKSVGADAGLRERAEALAKARSREGYMAIVEEDGEGVLRLIERHCPICTAAASCQGLCAMELDVFRRVLGPDAEVERVEHMLAEGRRCTYEVRPKRSLVE